MGKEICNRQPEAKRQPGGFVVAKDVRAQSCEDQAPKATRSLLFLVTEEPFSFCGFLVCGAQVPGGLRRRTAWNHLTKGFSPAQGVFEPPGRESSGLWLGLSISTTWRNKLALQDRSTKSLAVARALIQAGLAGCCSGHCSLALLHLLSSCLPLSYFPHLQSGTKANYSPLEQSCLAWLHLHFENALRWKVLQRAVYCYY